MFERIFRLSANGTSSRTEILAGVTTFMTMAYILAVNPQILSESGMDKGGVFTATILSSVIAMMIMAFYANLPVALAPGMGLNAFFVYTVVLNMGYSWQTALAAVFIEGLIFILMSFFNIREAIIDSIPASLKNAISAGIGLFIALIGLHNSGIITSSPSTLVMLGDLTNPSAYLTVAGIIIAGMLLIFKIRGALLLSIIIITLAGIPAGITVLPEGNIVSLPPSPENVFMKLDFSAIFTGEMIVVVLTFLFVDVFDTVGTLLGVCNKAGILDKNGKVPNAKQALLSDAVGTTFGAILGTSTVTSYVESASGIAEGGRTGMTTFVVACLFLVSLLLAPLFLMIPSAAISPVLIIVGLFMISPVKNIDFDDFSESVPVFLTIIMMPLAFSISDGIAFGIFSYVLIKVLTGKWKNVSIVMYILSILFALRYILL